MKRNLLVLVAWVLVASSVNAQVVKKFTEAADLGPAAGTVWDSGNGCKMTFYDTNAAVKANTVVTVGSETFGFSSQGSNNPKPWTYPAVGTAAMTLFDITLDGTLTVVAAISKTKRTYLAETDIVPNIDDYCYVLCGESGVTSYLYADENAFRAGATFVTAFNPETSNGYKIAGDSALYIWPDKVDPANSWLYLPISFNVKAGKCYNLFCTGSKAAIYGFVYTPGASFTMNVDHTGVRKSVVSTKYYSLAGTELRQVGLGSPKGLYIERRLMSDGSLETSKMLIK